MTPFAVTKRNDGAGVYRLMVGGELDEDTSDGLVVVMANAAGQADVVEIVVDLRRVSFLAAAGIRALLHGRAAAAGRGCAFRVVNAAGIVLQVIKISGVHHILAVTTEPEAAATEHQPL
ncbi:hypothetical protein Aab01nite_84670 [Paractinoplanes abujensis]|uniref:Anti-sigma factor antagonist n=1 Tax=Paractinoplanes abujensis TaxID=882441 RepID=A0A7W7CQX4_9ACTN|nr:anti-sigma factor antagonist [Actinoplanes abujensis]MBB4693091.1 anti-anti-sigma factor [Actinoplanes abujensis]GID24877.1 hypothetical protein Aab01nite_84670 [Actinoplanes abujensis]